MIELKLTVIHQCPEVLSAILTDFEAQTKIPVNVQGYAWHEVWDELSKIVQYGKWTDISENRYLAPQARRLDDNGELC